MDNTPLNGVEDFNFVAETSVRKLFHRRSTLGIISRIGKPIMIFGGNVLVIFKVV